MLTFTQEGIGFTLYRLFAYTLTTTIRQAQGDCVSWFVSQDEFEA